MFLAQEVPKSYMILLAIPWQLTTKVNSVSQLNQVNLSQVSTQDRLSNKLIAKWVGKSGVSLS